MKKILIAISCLTFAASHANSTEDKKRNGNENPSQVQQSTCDVGPVACTGTLNITKGGVYVSVKVVLNNDITSDGDCKEWVEKQKASLQEEIGDGYDVDSSYSYAGPK